MTARRVLPLLVAAVVLTTTTASFACPACGGGTMPKRVLDIYLFITVMLSAIPLLFGALVVSYARRGRDDDESR